MYVEFFGLKREPFSIAPDPRFLFMSERHREALAHLLYGLGGGGGFVLLSGEIGAGKTTVCRCFLEQVPKRCNVAYIFNPKLTVTELLKSVCDEFSIPHAHRGPGAPTVKDYVDPLNEFLLRTHAVGQNNVLIIDEAQNLSADVLEQLRLLTNLETNDRKLLQIILIGQPELRAMLERPELEQLAQRVVARFHLDALSEAETGQYIRHRLAVAGKTGLMPFDREARELIHKLSRGIPRRINLLCDRALLGAYANGKARVDRDIVEQAAREVFGLAEFAATGRSTRRRWAMLALAAAASAGLLAVPAYTLLGGGARQAAAPASRPAATLAAAASGAAPAVKPMAASGVAASAAGAASAPAFLAAGDLRSRFKSVTRDEREAWRELAPSWGLALAEGDPCQVAQRALVQCFRGSGSLAMVRQLGRPMILMLRDENDKPVYALLTGLTPTSATLRMGGVVQTVSLLSLATMWRGDFATFWRAPPGYASRLVDGASGPAVDWLAAKLAALRGEPRPAGQQKLDAALKAKVYEFQLSHELTPDGQPGPTTFMQLNRAAGVDEPRLSSETS